MDTAEPSQRERTRRTVIESFVYGDSGGNRFTQRSPIMLDVWTEFALEGPGSRDLLLVANRESTASAVAEQLVERLCADAPPGSADQADEIIDATGIVATQAAVAARLTFPQLLRAALPLTQYWDEYLYDGPALPGGSPSNEPPDPADLFSRNAPLPGVRAAMIAALDGTALPDGAPRYLMHDDLRWLIRVAGGIAHLHELPSKPGATAPWKQWLVDREDSAIVVDALCTLLSGVTKSPDPPPLWAIHSNRPAEMAIRKSMSTVKADAARHVFDVTGKGIRWAVLDSGIDATHVAFRRREEGVRGELPASDKKGESWTKKTRIACTYDFTHVRDLMALTVRQLDGYPEAVPAGLRERLSSADDRTRLRELLAARARSGRGAARAMIDWEQWLPLLRVEHVVDRYRVPKNPHGTHVAGILAADWRVHDLSTDAVAAEKGVADRHVARTGVCPELELWDVRVLDDKGASDEFSILAALQFVRASNARHEHQEVHGVNLSFSLTSKVRSYACGGTPVCVECERLVASGVVVVAAAGNYGRARYVGDTGEIDDGYRMASITDPGNASAVITVGATHRFEPHSYGVSYFSSRGPTGDGRVKPDLVAPGEKITAPVPGDNELSFDGTSAAAPHVSGAAALLLSRYPELRGRPAEVKRVLCATATDLGRDRYCQGAGLVDILRAMESI